MKDLKSPGENTSVFGPRWLEGIGYVRKLYQKAREDQADIAISNFDSIYPDRIIPHPYYPDCPNQEQLKQEIFSHLIGDWKKEQEWRPFTHWGYMWHILYKREILENHNIWFSDNREITYEDLLFWFRSFMQPTESLVFPWYSIIMFFTKKPGKQLYLQFNPTGDQPFNVLGSLPHYPSPQRWTPMGLFLFNFTCFMAYPEKWNTSQILLSGFYPISYHTQKSNHTAIGPGGPLFGPDGPKIENPKTALWLLLRL